MKVLTFGELLLRMSAPGFNKLFQKDYLECSFCGGEANVSVSLSCFGIQSIFVSKLPDNEIGRAAAMSLKSFGVDTSKILYGRGRMGLYFIEKGASQRPSKVIYDRAGSAISCATITDFDWDELFEGVDWFHFTGIDPALSESMFEITRDACRAAKRKGIVVSCDLNFRRKLWSPADAQKVMPSLIKYVDVCIGNEEDASLALGINPGGDMSNSVSSAKLYEEIARIICKDFGCRYVSFTLRESFSASRNGWSGCLFDGKEMHYSKHYEIQLVDRVGGGDSFSAGLIYGLVNNMSSQDALEFAVASSCLKQTIEGDFNRVTVADVEFLLNGNGSGRVQR